MTKSLIRAEDLLDCFVVPDHQATWPHFQESFGEVGMRVEEMQRAKGKLQFGAVHHAVMAIAHAEDLIKRLTVGFAFATCSAATRWAATIRCGV